MSRSIRKAVITLAALAALALGAGALADAASNGGSSAGSSGTTANPPAGRPPGRHIGANGKQEQALGSDAAAKVKAAAEARIPGGTVERVETDVDFGSPYEAHVRKSDGTEVSVLVNEKFEVTAVKAMRGPGGPGGPGGQPPSGAPGASAPGGQPQLYQQ
jgi:hypothetical protein